MRLRSMSDASAPVLAALSAGRDNNLNLVRMSAALLVVFTHAFGATGHDASEPLKALFGISFGTWAVNVFFAISGFLICKSWDRQPSIKRFVVARALRIYPALWVCIALCVCGLGAAFTTLPRGEYFAHIDTLKFVAINAVMILGERTTLPGVFDGQSINSPLWTLPYELRMYVMLLLLGSLGLLRKGPVLLFIVAVAAVGFGWGALHGHHADAVPQLCRFILCFFSGAAFYVWRDRIVLSHRIAGAMLLLLAASVAVLQVEWRILLLTLATPYLSLWAAYVPGGAIRHYNRVGDYSYGMYIYGTPVQMMLVETVSRHWGVGLNFVITAGLTLVVAALSWHILEKRALGWKNAFR